LVTQAVTEALPKMDWLAAAKEPEERLSKAMRAWWRSLPNDGVRLAIPLTAALLVAGVFTGLVVWYARRH
jgi:hypothetical protein